MQLHVTLQVISRIVRSEVLVYNSYFQFSDSHTNTVISHAVAYSSKWLPKPYSKAYLEGLKGGSR